MRIVDIMSFLFPKPRKTYIDKRGYLRFKDTDKLVHRWVVEKNLGHSLPPGAVVHHINQRKRDNRLSNLRVYSSQKEHQRVHSGCLFLMIMSGFSLLILLICLLLYLQVYWCILVYLDSLVTRSTFYQDNHRSSVTFTL